MLLYLLLASRHLGRASGLSYGIAVCAGGMAEPFLGLEGDAIGLVPVMLARAGLSVDEAFERYDAVIHLESLAAEESAAYGMEGNAARREDVLGARAMEERIRRAWAGHPHVSFVPARDGMDVKIGDALACVLSAAGCGRVLPHRRLRRSGKG